MIERALFQIIEDGIAYLRDTPGAVSKFLLSQGCMDRTEAEKTEELWRSKLTPRVAHGFAADPTTLPLFVILLGNDSPAANFVGNDGGIVEDFGDEDHGKDVYASIRSLQYTVLIWTQNADTTIAYYELLYQIIVNGIPELSGDPYWVSDVRLSGADVAPDKDYAPAGLFTRRLTVSCTREYEQVLRKTGEGRAWKVDGVHVTAEGALGEDPGAVQTLVTPYVEEEEDP